MGPGGGGAPPGLFPADRCVYCGYDGNGREWLVKQWVPLFGCEGWVCADIVRCERRRYAQKQLRLFGEGA